MHSPSLEAELLFVCFDPLNHNEYLVCTVVNNIIVNHADIISKTNMSFQEPIRPFLRMTYADTITTATST